MPSSVFSPQGAPRTSRQTSPGRRLSVFDRLFAELVEGAAELKTQIKEGRFDEVVPVGDRKIPKLVVDAKRVADQLQSLQAHRFFATRVVDDSKPYRHGYLWALSWAADALEYVGDTARTRSLIGEEGAALASWLFTMPTLRPVDRILARQKVWVVLHYAYACLYRQYEYDKALNVVDLCDEFVNTRLKDERAFPCFYTRARIAAYRAAIQRQLSNLNQAQRSYEQSLEFIYKRLAKERHADSGANAGRLDQEETRASYEAAKILALGIGWCQYTQGLLHEARVNVLTALVMLSPIHDVLRKAYAQLLMGSIERAETGFNVDELSRAIKTLEQPHATFVKFQHRRYVSRADYELALAHLYRANAQQESGFFKQAAEDYALAEKYILRVLQFSTDVGDRRWESVALIVLSRIARGRIARATDHHRVEGSRLASDFARRALALTKNVEQDIELRLDAEIACGEAMMASPNPSWEDLAQALRHFEEALSRGGNNPKALGISHLHLAQAHLRNNDVRKALEHFDNWKLHRHRVQHGLVHGMADRIEHLIDDARQSWYVAPGHKTLNYNHHERKLREFLMTQAAARGETVDAIAESLGIKRATYYNWLKELRTSGGAK